MSYYKAKSISIKGNQIFMSVADSSFTPTTYYTTEYMETSNKNIDEKLGNLLKSINNGGIHLNDSLYKWNTALYKTNTELGYANYYSGIRTDGKDLNEENIKEYVNCFRKYFNEKHDGEYYLYSPRYGNIRHIGTNGNFYYEVPQAETMDYFKAFFLSKKIGQGIEVKAVPRREYKPTNEQVVESKKRIELLGLEPRLSDKLYMSDRYYTREVKDGEVDLIRAINNFEKDYNAYVYYIIYTKSNFGNLYSMFYVSNYKEEWKDDNEMLKHGETYAYCYNKTNEICSEIGLIGFKNNKDFIERTF